MSNLLCAIAKNEGAYLAEWIHYHLKCGFDSIWVYVNGTDDYSIDILESISKHHPVEYVICDYINDESYSEDTSHIREGFLKNNKIQSCAYNEAIKKAKDIYNYVMFLDIDEFFISPDMNIKNLINKHENSDVISMKWYLEAGEHDEFDYVLKNTISCTPSRQIKSITKLKGNYDNILIHSSHSNRVIGGNKVVLEHNTGYFIFHRHLRSHNEYLSLLYRGDTIKNTGNSLKLNRAGFNFNHDNKIQIDSAIVSRFKKSYLEFIETCGISDFLHHSEEKSHRKLYPCKKN